MSSHNRLRDAVERGILPTESVRAALGTLGTSAAERLVGADQLFSPDYAVTASTEFTAALEHVFDTAKKLYETRLGYMTPTMSELEAAGYDTNELFEAYDTMHLDGLQPEIVLAPELSLGSSQTLVASLMRDPTVPNKRPLNLLDVDDEITATAWRSYTAQRPAGQPVLFHDGTHWTISVLSGRYAPQYRNTDYRTLPPIHPTISQLLALHYQRIQTGGEMIDGARDGMEFWSWAAGEPGISYAPTVRWCDREDRIIVSLYLRFARNESIGTRPPQWSHI